MDIIRSGAQGKPSNNSNVHQQKWNVLEEQQYRLWKQEKAQNTEDARQSANYKIQSLKNNFEAKKKIIYQQLSLTDDVNITRMRKQQLENETEKLKATSKNSFLSIQLSF